MYAACREKKHRISPGTSRSPKKGKLFNLAKLKSAPAGGGIKLGGQKPLWHTHRKNLFRQPTPPRIIFRASLFPSTGSPLTESSLDSSCSSARSPHLSIASDCSGYEVVPPDFPRCPADGTELNLTSLSVAGITQRSHTTRNLFPWRVIILQNPKGN